MDLYSLTMEPTSANGKPRGCSREELSVAAGFMVRTDLCPGAW